MIAPYRTTSGSIKLDRPGVRLYGNETNFGHCSCGKYSYLVSDQYFWRDHRGVVRGRFQCLMAREPQ